MKMSLFCLSLSAFLLVGCHSTKNGYSRRSQGGYPTSVKEDTALSNLSPEQLRLIGKYEGFHLRIALEAGLDQNATWEQIRPKAALFLGLKPEAAWEDIFKVPRVGEALTEEKRDAFMKAFALEAKAGAKVTWSEIAAAVDAVRAKLKRTVWTTP